MATPETIWLPRWVIEAKPCTSAKATETSDRGKSPSQAEPVDAATAAGGEGADQHLAFEADVENAGALGIEPGEAGEQQRHATGGWSSRGSDDGNVEEVHLGAFLTPPCAAASARHRRSSASSVGPEHVLERAGEQDDQALDDDDHVAGDRRHVEGELGAALVEHAEQDRGEHDADRMRAAHQRDRDADEAGAAARSRCCSRCWSPMIGFSAIMPASAPEISMVMMVMR